MAKHVPTTPAAVPDVLSVTHPADVQHRYVRATGNRIVTLHQPLARNRHRVIEGKLLGETHVRGALHHYRVTASDGTVILAPPEWLAPDCRYLVVMAGLTVPEHMRAGMWVAAIEELTRRFAKAEPVA